MRKRNRILPVVVDKRDIGQRFASEMARLDLSAARIAEKLSVTIQAINGWKSTGRIARKHHEELGKLGFNIPWLLTGDEAVRDLDLQRQELTPDEDELILAYRSAPETLKSAIWGAIDDYVRRTYPSIADRLSLRDTSTQRSTEERKPLTAQKKTSSRTPHKLP